VAVEIYDPHNKSIVNKTYILERKSDLSEPRPLSLKLNREKREYTFKVTMDKQITNSTKVNLSDSHTSVDIRLYHKNYGEIPYVDYESPEIIPIFIETAKWKC
jgi:hypothetical protein